jgi:hypothetical protein
MLSPPLVDVAVSNVSGRRTVACGGCGGGVGLNWECEKEHSYLAGAEGTSGTSENW